jgi:hypothetical protein
VKSAVALLELGTEIARIHERSGTGTTTVVPVIVGDLVQTRPILRALCELLQGRLLDTAELGPSGSELDSPVPVTADTARREAIATTLATSVGRRVTIRDVEGGGGLADASLDKPITGGEQSAGDRAVTALARAVMHRDLDRYDFAVIAYESSSMDILFRRAAWQLTAEKLASMSIGGLRTLVIVTEAAIDIELHCETNTGFRFAIDDSRLLRRQGRDNLRANAATISKHQGPLVLFLGAGFAQSSRMPLGNAVRDGAIRRLLAVQPSESPTSTDLAKRFHDWLAEKPGWLSLSEQQMPQEDFVKRLTLERVIRAEARMSDGFPTLVEFLQHHNAVVDAPGSAVLDLAKVLSRGSGRVILVEVNFDLLVETHAGVPLRVFATDQEFAEAPGYLRRYLDGKETAIPLLKIHGTITDLATCVVSEDQTERGIGPEKLAALRELLGRSEPRLWIYVGTSMRDRDLLRALKGEEFARGLDERWVCPYLLDTVAEYGAERAAFWTKLPTIEDRLITEKADAFFAALSEYW